jgi:hypothetical protein
MLVSQSDSAWTFSLVGGEPFGGGFMRSSNGTAPEDRKRLPTLSAVVAGFGQESL